MIAFATFEDLGKRLARDFTPIEQSQVTVLLEDAADFMRGVIGNQVYPSATATYVTSPVGGWVTLPQTPVRSVDAVTRDGVDLDWKQVQDSIKVVGCDPVTVTFTYGLASAPSDLIGINCALAGQMLLTVEAGLGLTAGGLSSVALDDFKAAFADAGAGTGLSLTDATRSYLQTNYGSRAWVVGMNR